MLFRSIEVKRQAARQKLAAGAARKAEEERARIAEKAKAHQSSLDQYGHTRVKNGQVMNALVGAQKAKAKSWSPSPACSAEQIDALRAVQQGRNLFITGPAGVGKSFLIGQIKAMLDFCEVHWALTAYASLGRRRADLADRPASQRSTSRAARCTAGRR